MKKEIKKRIEEIKSYIWAINSLVEDIDMIMYPVTKKELKKAEKWMTKILTKKSAKNETPLHNNK